MNDLLLKRINRKLETLPDERLYQVLDYVEFLESKYASRSGAAVTPLQKLAEKVEDTLRAGKVSASTIRGAMDVFSGAGRVMEGLASAGKAVVDQVAGGAESTPPPAPPPPSPPPSSPPPPAGEAPARGDPAAS